MLLRARQQKRIATTSSSVLSFSPSETRSWWRRVFQESLKLDSDLPKVCQGGMCFCDWVLPLARTVAVGAFKVPKVMLWHLKQWLCPSFTFVPKTTPDCGCLTVLWGFLAVLSLRCCAQSFSSCSELLFLAVPGLLIVCSLVEAHRL